MAASDGGFDGAAVVSTSSLAPASSTTEVTTQTEAPTGTETPTTSEAPTTTEAPVTARYDDGTYVGTAEYTEWGDVQVEVTVSGGEIVDVAVLQVPNDRRSQRINDAATPQLEAQAVAIQGADLDVVSGATYTSRTYATSLQAALDQAASEPLSAAAS